MIRNYLKLAIRNLFKRKGYASLNILGLVIGVTCCLLIFQYVSYERSYDSFQSKSAQIVRVRLDQYKQGQLQWQSATSYPGIAPALKRDYPEVQDYCRLHDWSGILVNSASNLKFKETKGYYADPSAIHILDLQLLKGSAANALNGPNQMVISESTAKKFFGSSEALGQHLQTPNGSANTSYVVTGVFRDYPKNSHLIINCLASYATLEQETRSGPHPDTTDAVNTSFGWYDFYTYLQLKPGTDYKKFEAKLGAFSEKYMNSREWNRTNNIRNELSLIPLTDIHLYSNYNQEAEINGSGQSVSFMFLISFLIIGIAWINYINLATARSVERAREVGVRKVLGALKTDLVRQFLLESLLLNLIGFALSLIAVRLLSPAFNTMMGRESGFAFHITTKYWLIFLTIFAGGTILSGLYPALVLSGYKPVVVLKGLFKNSSGGLVLRKGLIIVQFAISVILIAGTIIVFQQVNYMRGQELGANIQQTLVLDGAQSVTDSVYQDIYQPFKNEVLQLPSVKSMAASSNVMGQEIYWTRGVMALQNATTPTAVTLYILGVDYDFIPQYDLKLAAGRNFSKTFPIDEKGKTAMLNERAVQLLGFKNAEDALNKQIVMRDTLTIVGIVQNFHQLGLQKPVDPQLMLYTPGVRDNYSIKLQSANMHQNVAAIEKIWNKYFPNDPFSYFFLNDFYNQQYQADQQFGKMFTLFSFLAILIACFGLLGLSSYNIAQRTKEIGIRKVLGASTKNVIYILSKDFLLLVIGSFVFAIPIAWYVMHQWLQDYAYRINIKSWVFMIAGLISVTIALLTISFQAIRAALANPVKSLRTE